MQFPLDSNGFILNWLTTMAVAKPFIAPYTDKNQLKFEHEMRQILKQPLIAQPQTAVLDAESQIGAVWKYYSANASPYVNDSMFYYLLKNVDMLCATTIVSKTAQRISARVWTYFAMDIWVNGIKNDASINTPVYKPINFVDLELDLKEGENEIFVCLQNLGVRDTRNIFALQLKNIHGITVQLNGDQDIIQNLHNAENWLNTLVHDKDNILAPSAPPCAMAVTTDTQKHEWLSGDTFPINGGFLFKFSADLHGHVLSRSIEIKLNENPEFIIGETNEQRQNRILEGMSKYTQNSHTTPYNIMAGFMLNGGFSKRDYEALNYTLDRIEERIDCSDFGLSGLLRMYMDFPLDDSIKARIKDVSLRFRYWMDEDAADAMCFWSENHSLLFHACQMITGRLWPDDAFVCSGRTGREQEPIGYRRCSEWLDLVEKAGFEEFLAGGYMSVTIAALMLLVDYGDDKMSKRACGVIDRIASEAAIQCFKGVHIAPMGRIYRSVLSPHKSGLQALLHILSDTAAVGYATFLAPLFFSKNYTLPSDISTKLDAPVDTSFNTGHAEVFTKKTKDYIVTSVASPRRTPLEDSIDKTSESYATMRLNEGFHGTTLFVPGEHGYQQHMMYAAISPQAFTFVNHPGMPKDVDGMRPGYWYGNVVFPSVSQDGSTIHIHYNLPDTQPINFTHVYWPAWAMERSIITKNVLFGMCGNGYMAVKCDKDLVAADDIIVGGEYRAYGDNMSWVLCCGSKDEFGSFEAFMEWVEANVRCDCTQK